MNKMTIEIVSENDEDGGSQKMTAEYLDEKIEISQSEGEWMCPEDRLFCRDLNSPDSYLKFIKMDHKCGINGDEILII
jgi:hypothetical protein